MGVSQEDIGSLILAKIQIYILTRAELLFTLCSEIPCKYKIMFMHSARGGFWDVITDPKSTSFIFQVILMAVQWGNVQCVQGAYGESAFEELDEIFYIVQPNNILIKKNLFWLANLLKRE
jgi:hypothetical protein